MVGEASVVCAQGAEVMAIEGPSGVWNCWSEPTVEPPALEASTR